jgi:hypothetical protein
MNKTIKEIKLWTWTVIVIFFSGISAMFFVWTHGLGHWFNLVIIIGSTLIFTVVWWATHVFKKLLDLWANTEKGLSEVLSDVKEIRDIVKTTMADKEDK